MRVQTHARTQTHTHTNQPVGMIPKMFISTVKLNLVTLFPVST